MTVDNRKISGQVKVTKRREKKGVHGFFFWFNKKKIKKRRGFSVLQTAKPYI